MAFLDPALNPVFLPLLERSPFLGILILSFIISLIIVLAYKYFTNQEAMKQIKEQQKEYQRRMKELRNSPDEAMKIQKEAMGKNFEYMKHSFKATFITIIPIIIIFGWMNSHLLYEPIYPGEAYSVTAKFVAGLAGEAELIADEGTELLSPSRQQINSDTTWTLKSTAGEHFVTVKAGTTEQAKKLLITTELKTEQPLSLFRHSDLEQIRVNYKKLLPLGPSVSLLGWQPGWLGVYILLSIVFSVLLRKVLKVY
ncbi:MAG: EMC3/TMCO1 family protein [Nanoarchaeota archaeon]|mgnify:FL=1